MKISDASKIYIGNTQASKIALGSQQVWPLGSGITWEPYVGFTVPDDTQNGITMAVKEVKFSESRTDFLIAIGNPYNNSNRGKIKIFIWSSATPNTAPTEINYSSANLKVGSANNDYYGRSMAWSETGLYLIVGAPKTDNFRFGNGDGKVRIFYLSGNILNKSYTLNLYADHYNVGSWTVNNVDGWINGMNWNNGTIIGSFGWAVALNYDGNRAYVSAPAHFSGLGIVLKRDYLINPYNGREEWGILTTQNYGPNEFYYKKSTGGNSWVFVSPCYFGVEMFFYTKDNFTLDNFLVVRTANNTTDTTPYRFYLNAIVTYKVRGLNTTNADNSVYRIIAQQDPENSFRHLSLNFDDDNLSIKRTTMAAGDNFLVLGSTLLNNVRCFDFDPQRPINPNIASETIEYFPWKTLNGAETWHKFGSTVSARKSEYTDLEPVFAVSQVDYFNTQNRGAISAYKGNDATNPTDVSPYSTSIFNDGTIYFEYGASQERVGYCSFVSSDARWVIYTTPNWAPAGTALGKITILRRSD